LKAACKQHAAVHLYSVTTKRSNYKMGVLLHCGKSSTRERGEGGRSKSKGWEDQPLSLNMEVKKGERRWNIQTFTFAPYVGRQGV
jgi:hypothetical protein